MLAAGRTRALRGLAEGHVPAATAGELPGLHHAPAEGEPGGQWEVSAPRTDHCSQKALLIFVILHWDVALIFHNLSRY